VQGRAWGSGEGAQGGLLGPTRHPPCSAPGVFARAGRRGRLGRRGGGGAVQWGARALPPRTLAVGCAFSAPRPPGQCATAHATPQATPPGAQQAQGGGGGQRRGGGACGPCRGVEGVQSGGRALRCCSSCSARQRPARTLPGAPQQPAGSAQREEAQHRGRAGGGGGRRRWAARGASQCRGPRKGARLRVQRGPCDTCLGDSCAGGCSQASSSPCAKKPKDKCR
jgi:hypothetical protein